MANGRMKIRPHIAKAAEIGVVVQKGRPSKYAGVVDDTRAHEFALLGYVDSQIAEAMGISASTLYNWKRKYPKFAAAIVSGGIRTNVRVVQALLARALGGIVVKTKEVKLRNSDGSERIEILKLERFIPPDTRAIIFWLTNRDPEHWKIYKPADYPPPPPPSSALDALPSPELIAEVDRMIEALR